MRPRHSLSNIRPGAGISEFAVSSRLFVFLTVPVEPSLWPNLFPHLAIDKGRRRVRPPGPTQVNRPLFQLTVRRQFAMEKNVAVWLVLLRRGGREISFVLAADFAGVGDGGG